MKIKLSTRRFIRGIAPLLLLLWLLLVLLTAGVTFYLGWRIVELIKAIQEGRIRSIEEIERGTPSQGTPEPTNHVARVSFFIPTPA